MRRLSVLAVVLAAGCAGSSSDDIHERARAGSPEDVAAIRAALGPSGRILTPFRPGGLGRKSCAITRGGPPAFRPMRIAARCATVVSRVDDWILVSFRQTWAAKDFRGSGGRFRRRGSRRRLSTTWRVTLSHALEVVRVDVIGDLPPQLVR